MTRWIWDICLLYNPQVAFGKQPRPVAPNQQQQTRKPLTCNMIKGNTVLITSFIHQHQDFFMLVVCSRLGKLSSLKPSSTHHQGLFYPFPSPALLEPNTWSSFVDRKVPLAVFCPPCMNVRCESIYTHHIVHSWKKRSEAPKTIAIFHESSMVDGHQQTLPQHVHRWRVVDIQ